MSGRLQGKVTIVTGGGAGFGRGIVEKFVLEGSKVLIWDIHPTSAEELAKALPENTCASFVGDVSRLEDWEKALQSVLDKWGALDVVVNNAGVVHAATPSIDLPEDEVDRMWRINVKPLYFSAKVCVPYWREKKRPGLFINLSSISAPRPRPNVVWYAASKGAVTAATRGLAAEFAKDGIRCNCIQPVVGETAMLALVQGGTDSPEGRAALTAGIPLGRFTQPQDIANAACYLASDEATFLTGVCMDVDGGRSLN
ncbi:uncharacterized protein PV09_00761 [Verruconis gallopava]|uniref:3-oxoacyl-[acyl-carrier protein] reductase n=1 Tax=Verruconis gallopava TaxID=253628 RepID=A0A0D1Y182_9PEZI|nr:uncharacterized protein PV09_00761 [Verruconis gallopava]KIW08831.1 hypothetical protein PV09_00761 [Verruconis gallopava]